MMKLLCVVVGAALGASALPLQDDSRAAFEQWKATHRPAGYASDAEDAAKHRCFRLAVAEANELNRRLGDSAVFGLNDRSDMCPSDTTDHPPADATAEPASEQLSASRLAELPAALDSIDWREKGAVLPYVKNQGHCGSCWSFGSSANMEAVWFLHSGKLLDLSEQELVSCAHAVNGSAYPKGCQGGSGATHSYTWVVLNGGLDTTADYGNYTSGTSGENGVCHFRKLKDDAAGPFSSWLVLPKNETAMAQWVSTHGPLSVHIDAKGWNSYRGGVASFEPSTSLDHVVMIVGYGTDDDSGKDYWTIRNSWGGDWGEDGYIRIERGVGASGVSQEAATIVV